MAAASAALAPASGRTAVVFHGMAGGGKTTCALELAYRHQRAFEALAFWSAPTDPEQFGDALRRLALAWEKQLGDDGFTMVDKIATLANLDRFLPRLSALLHTEPEPLRRPETADPALGRRVLTLVQGHPKLLELADAAAADRPDWPPNSRRPRPPWTTRR